MAPEPADLDITKAFDMTGKVAFITGGASGIGEAAALTVANAGASVCVADINVEGAQATVDAITAVGGSAIALAVDITSRDAVFAAVARCRDEFGGLDLMANVAGIAHEGKVADLTEADVDRVIAINLKGTLWGCQAAIGAMKETGGGSIVNVASASIDVAAPGYGLYAMTKSAIAQLTMNMTWEVGRYGIRVNTLAPGATVTPFTARHAVNEDGSVNQEAYDQFVQRMTNISPIKQVGEAMDQAWLILYLASDAGRFSTGQVWRANGGQAIVR